MKKHVFKVSGMSCAHCENRVNKAVLALEEVTSCEANAKSGTVIVNYEEKDGAISKIITAIEDAGYSVES